MSFHLSQKSLDKLVGIDPKLAQVVKLAIDYTKVDFGVTEGLRTIEKQREYFEAGKSQTMSSKHIDGKAVDLVAYVGGTVCWELNVYDDLADAMKAAAIELAVPIRWGAAWNIPDIRAWRGTMEEAMNYYIDERRKQNKRPFIDGPHFELA
jgi:peptidoglycan L-alanyl-D-glutamate endopeptidase CwlK